ncbi:ATP-binding protein [Neptunicella marina]|uniref:histidine kinase n=1 Tax=Neptunicella marina TaxID=2125989 RepID=A0A8J6IWT9_9ALTE|nr:ATP-binding protein [Neptunicella marina]MBC3767564.1 hypothetical protein [Neptunicella marina]
MFKSFIGLWLVVFAPLFFLLYPHSYSPIQLFNNHIESTRFIQAYRGSFYLLQQALQSTSADDQQHKLADLQQQFGFELKLSRLSDFANAPAVQQDLINNQIVFINSEPEWLAQRLTDSQWVVMLAVDFALQEEIKRGAQGTVFLLKQQLSQLPVESWPSTLKQLEPHFAARLYLQTKEQFSLTPLQNRQMAEFGFSWKPEADGQLTFITQLNDSTYLIAQALPISSANPFNIIYLLLVFVVLISLCMFLWVWPLWRDIGKLSKAASDFGAGQLNAQASLAKTSAISALGAQFNTMAKRIEELINNQRQLTNAIAHDLRTPLYRLRFAFEMLDSPELTPQDIQRYRERISGSIDDLDHLINQTLVLARYNRSSLPLNMTRVMLADKLKQDVQIMQLQQPAVQFDIQIAPSLQQQTFYLDESAFMRAVNNLLANASRFAHSQIRISVQQQGEHRYSLSVEDDGEGVKDEDKTRILLPFTQASGSTNTTTGHGLGLAIVQQIAQLHNGTVLVENSLLGGARFTLCWTDNQDAVRHDTN